MSSVNTQADSIRNGEEGRGGEGEGVGDWEGGEVIGRG